MSSNTTDGGVNFWYEDKDYYMMVGQTVHVFLGYLGVAFNLIICFVIYKTGTAGVQFIAILALVDLSKNVKEICDSATRVLAITMTTKKINYSNLMVPRFLCLLMPTTHGDFIHYSYAQVVTLAIALERFIAVYKPMWYNKKWQGANERKYRNAVLGYATVVVSLHYASYAMWPNIASSVICNMAGSPWLGQYNYIMKFVFAGLAALLTILAVLKGRSLLKTFSSGDDKDLKLLNRLNRTAAVVVLVNSVLVMLPNFYFFLHNNKVIVSDMNKRSIIWSLDVANSTINLPVLLLTNSDFRKRCYEAFYTAKNKPATQVSNLMSQTQN